MKLQIQAYKIRTRQRDWLSCQENKSNFKTVTETRYRIFLGKTVLSDGITSKANAESILAECWTAEGLAKAIMKADDEYFNTLKEASESRKQEVERIFKRMEILDRAHQKVNPRPNRRR